MRRKYTFADRFLFEQQKARFAGGLLNQSLAGDFLESSSLGDDFMHPKNSTATKNTQQPPLTAVHPYHTYPGTHAGYFAVTPNVAVIDALNEASNLFGAAIGLLSRLMDGGLDGNDAPAVRFLVEPGKALIDSAMDAVEFGQGGEA